MSRMPRRTEHVGGRNARCNAGFQPRSIGPPQGHEKHRPGRKKPLLAKREVIGILMGERGQPDQIALLLTRGSLVRNMMDWRVNPDNDDAKMQMEAS
jgi:hypothetical protein